MITPRNVAEDNAAKAAKDGQDAPQKTTIFFPERDEYIPPLSFVGNKCADRFSQSRKKIFRANQTRGQCTNPYFVELPLRTTKPLT